MMDKMTEEGKMLSGCIVRHLVMPLCSSDSKALIKWFAHTLSKDTYLSLMSQYTPFGKIEKFPELNRPITPREYNTAVETAFELGITHLFAHTFRFGKYSRTDAVFRFYRSGDMLQRAFGLPWSV